MTTIVAAWCCSSRRAATADRPDPSVRFGRHRNPRLDWRDGPGRGPEGNPGPWDPLPLPQAARSRATDASETPSRWRVARSAGRTSTAPGLPETAQLPIASPGATGEFEASTWALAWSAQRGVAVRHGLPGPRATRGSMPVDGRMVDGVRGRREGLGTAQVVDGIAGLQPGKDPAPTSPLGRRASGRRSAPPGHPVNYPLVECANRSRRAIGHETVSTPRDDGPRAAPPAPAWQAGDGGESRDTP